MGTLSKFVEKNTTKIEAKMLLRLLTVLMCLLLAQVYGEQIECPTGPGVSEDDKFNIPVSTETCNEGVKQCQISGDTAGDISTYTFGCSDTSEEHEDKCFTKGPTKTCYCTGSSCTPPDPIKNSANAIGTQITIGFALFLTIFNKIMASI